MSDIPGILDKKDLTKGELDLLKLIIINGGTVLMHPTDYQKLFQICRETLEVFPELSSSAVVSDPYGVVEEGSLVAMYTF